MKHLETRGRSELYPDLTFAAHAYGVVVTIAIGVKSVTELKRGFCGSRRMDNHLAIRTHQDRVSVGWGANCRIHPNKTTGARTILNNDGLPPFC